MLLNIQLLSAFGCTSFSHSSTAEIKSYLVEYCAQKNKLGYIALEDPLSSYYEALCTGLETAGLFIGEDENTIPRWSLSFWLSFFLFHESCHYINAEF